jgi:hypothetical protein
MDVIKRDPDFNDKSGASASASDQQDGEYASFQDLSGEQWREWLSAFLAGDSRPPLVAVADEEGHQVLIRIFDSLNAKGSILFKRALFQVFETTPIIRMNEQQLYYLLHVIAYCVPVEAKKLLRRRLREGIFRRLTYGHQNLHNLLLVVCSKYNVDDELFRYVQRSARASKDFDYRLLCQRVVSTVEGPYAYHFIERLLPLMNSSEEAAAAIRQLTSISERLGYHDLLDWYRSRSIELALTWEQHWSLFTNALRNRLLTDRALPVLARQDRDAVLLYAELRIAEDLIQLNSILTIAKLHEHIGVEDTSAILVDIWKALYDRSGEVPWQYMGSQEKMGATRLIGAGTIYRERDDFYVEEPVQVTADPETERVLIEVRERCEPLIAPKTRVAGQTG